VITITRIIIRAKIKINKQMMTIWTATMKTTTVSVYQRLPAREISTGRMKKISLSGIEVRIRIRLIWTCNFRMSRDTNLRIQIRRSIFHLIRGISSRCYWGESSLQLKKQLCLHLSPLISLGKTNKRGIKT